MKKIALNFICILLALHTAYSQWKWQNFKPQGNDLKSVFFVSDKVGWMAGKFGTILKTTDGGTNWNINHFDSLQTINTIYFTSENVGYAAGSNGIVIKTTDGGITWAIKKYDPTLEIKTMFFISKNIGWIGGERIIGMIDSTLFKTSDGGETWQKQEAMRNFEPQSIHFFSESHGWIAGSAGEGNIYRTTDGGKTWDAKYIDHRYYTSIFSVSESTAYVVLNFGEFRKTTDGGNTWELQHITYQGSDVHFESQFFISESVGWICGRYDKPAAGYKHIIYKTTDGGKSLKIIKADLTYPINSLNFTSEKTGWGAGDYGFMVSTSDGGSSWIEQSKSISSEFNSFSDVDFISPNSGWVVGEKGCILKTTNGGNEWIEYSVDQNININSVDFVSEATGWATAARKDTGIILKTTNGGLDWKIQFQSSEDYVFKRAYFISENVGWVVGINSIYKTSNGGITWEKYNDGFAGSSWWQGLFFINDKAGWRTGPGRTILKTTDSGINWTTIQVQVNTLLPDCEFYLGALYFVSERIGWVVGAGGLILKTTDGGESWQEQMNTGSWHDNLFSICFISDNMGWAVGCEGRILKTTNGGETWECEKSYSDRDLFDIIVLNEETGWIVGRSGVILSLMGNEKTNIVQEQTKEIPPKIKLLQNYPNPFNPETIISYQLPKFSCVEVKVYDILGYEISTIVKDYQDPGQHKIIFDGSNLASGIYFYQIKAGNFTVTKNMLLIK